MEPLNAKQDYGTRGAYVYTGDVSVALTPAQTRVELQCGASKTFTVTLPLPALMAGEIVSVYLASPASGSTITVASPTGSPAVTTDALTAAADNLVFYSDGIRYICINNVTT